MKRGCTKIAIGDVNVAGLAETKKQMLEVKGAIEVLDAECGIDALECNFLCEHLSADTMTTDVTSEESVNTFFTKTVAKFGRLDYCCNVAGMLIPGPSTSLSATQFDKQHSVNCRGMWLCQRAEITQMLKQDPIDTPDSAFQSRGAIANVASMAGIRGYDNLASYSSTKHAILGFTKCDAYGYAPQLIRVNAVCPGVIATPMLGEVDPNDKTNIAEMTKDMAMGRQGQPEEVAEGLLWLCSSYASFVTGIGLPVNGGMVGA